MFKVTIKHDKMMFEFIEVDDVVVFQKGDKGFIEDEGVVYQVRMTKGGKVYNRKIMKDEVFAIDGATLDRIYGFYQQDTELVGALKSKVEELTKLLEVSEELVDDFRKKLNNKKGRKK